MIKNLFDLSSFANYSFLDSLNCNPEATIDGDDKNPREVFTGHYVLVKPTPIKDPIYITHSKNFFKELRFSDTLATSEDFMKMFSGELSHLNEPMKKYGWACGYALSIYGTEYYDQCPFKTGNGYGDGRAISIFEALINNKPWEMQLKGGGRTPYCRGADGRAVLRSSIREFLASEHMYALNVPTSRSLCLYTSNKETVMRPWFKNNSYSKDPEVIIQEQVAISTRVAPSFIRVGQIELFGRRARKKEHPKAMNELEKIVLHTIDKEYNDVIDSNLPIDQKVLNLLREYCDRLTSLVANWIRVGYCQGNFNSDNCAIGGFTLDYGPFGFIDMFDPEYQPWTGGGIHFSFFNQPQAAIQNFNMLCIALKPLINSNQNLLKQLEEIKNEFPRIMEKKIEQMWASKLGLNSFDENLFMELMNLMIETNVDYTIFFRELSSIPKDIKSLEKSFYDISFCNDSILKRWSNWLNKWRKTLESDNSPENIKKVSQKMKTVNPKYTLKEWFLVPAYKEAEKGNYELIKELQTVMTNPYDEQTKDIEEKYYMKKPNELFNIAGVSHISCSS